MKIALFTDTYNPDVNGVATHVAGLQNGLLALNQEVLIVTTCPHTKIQEDFLNNIVRCPSMTLKKVYGLGLSLPINLKQLHIIKKFKPDVIHIHTEFGIGLFGVLVAKILKKPVIYTLHTIYDDYIHYVVPRPLVKTGQKIFYKYIKSLYKKATIITGPSPKSLDYLQKAGLNRNIEIIPNPVDVDKFSKKNVSLKEINELKHRFNISDNNFVSCIVSRIGTEKSINVLINYISEYVKINDNFKFLIVGDGPAKKDLEKQVKKLNINNYIIFTGKIPNNQLLPYYAISKAFLTASLSDTNSISMLEAMSMGLPIIQREDPINKGQVVENVNGFIFNNLDTFIEKMDKIYKMSLEDYSNFSAKVRDSVIKNNTSKNMAKKILRVYNQAVDIYK